MKNIFCTLFFMSQIQSLTLFNFNSSTSLDEWVIVNDNVMGGKSTSSINLKKHKGVFQGKVSLENNGGFAMTQYNCNIDDLTNYKKIVIKLKGDGKIYQFRIKNQKFNMHSYVQNFKTSGKQETIELNLKDFKPQFRGVKLDMDNFDKNKIEQLAILIGNKKNEEFKIQIDKILLK